MQKIKVGDNVRQAGKKQIMTAKGDVGVATSSMSAGKVSTSPGMAVCVWTNADGRIIQKSFFELGLELASAGIVPATHRKNRCTRDAHRIPQMRQRGQWDADTSFLPTDTR